MQVFFLRAASVRSFGGFYVGARSFLIFSASVHLDYLGQTLFLCLLLLPSRCLMVAHGNVLLVRS